MSSENQIRKKLVLKIIISRYKVRVRAFGSGAKSVAPRRGAPNQRLRLRAFDSLGRTADGEGGSGKAGERCRAEPSAPE